MRIIIIDELDAIPAELLEELMKHDVTVACDITDHAELEFKLKETLEMENLKLIAEKAFHPDEQKVEEVEHRNRSTQRHSRGRDQYWR